VVILLTTARVIIMISCAVLSHRNFVANISKFSSEASAPTCGGDAFGTELTKCSRFGSLGLNLTFKGLLLGVSLRILMEGTRSDPCQSGS
jgi:hypothetical protein